MTTNVLLSNVLWIDTMWMVPAVWCLYLAWQREVDMTFKLIMTQRRRYGYLVLSQACSIASVIVLLNFGSPLEIRHELSLYATDAPPMGWVVTFVAAFIVTSPLLSILTAAYVHLRPSDMFSKKFRKNIYRPTWAVIGKDPYRVSPQIFWDTHGRRRILRRVDWPA